VREARAREARAREARAREARAPRVVRQARIRILVRAVPAALGVADPQVNEWPRAESGLAQVERVEQAVLEVADSQVSKQPWAECDPAQAERVEQPVQVAPRY
jgi:hypothetical protein